MYHNLRLKELYMELVVLDKKVEILNQEKENILYEISKLEQYLEE